MNVHVPQTWDYVPARSVDHLPTVRHADPPRGSNRHDACSGDHRRLILARECTGSVDDGRVLKDQGVFILSPRKRQTAQGEGARINVRRTATSYSQTECLPVDQLSKVAQEL